MRDLPSENYVIGIEISMKNGEKIDIDNKSLPFSVSLQLADSRGKILFAKGNSLSNWTWSTDQRRQEVFVYGQKGERTYFDAKEDEEYLLTVVVNSLSTNADTYNSRLLAKSGGWK